MARTVRCPQCGQEVVWSPESPWRPFCSERCRLIDLGAWAAGSYRIPAEETDPESDFDPEKNKPRS